MFCLANQQYVVAPLGAASARGCRRRNIRLARRTNVSGGVKIFWGRDTRWKVTAAMAMVPSHCVVDAGGGEDSTAYYNYSFSTDEPSDAGSKVLESAGINVYMTEAALQSKRFEPDAREPPPAPEMEGKTEEDKAEEATVAAAAEPTHVNIPAPVKTPDMVHCVVEAFGNAAYQYLFAKDRPAGVGTPTFESAGVSVYMTEAALEAKRAEIAPEPPAAPALPVAPEPAVEAAEEKVVAAAAEPVTLATSTFTKSLMRHCVVSSPGGDDQLAGSGSLATYYSFSEDKPAGVNSPDLESAGFNVYYLMEALKTVNAADATLTTVASKDPGADIDEEEKEEEEEFVDVRKEFVEQHCTEYSSQLRRALRTVDPANITFAVATEEQPTPVEVETAPVEIMTAPVEEDRTVYSYQLRRALRTVDPANITFAVVAEEEPAPVEVEPTPVEVAAPSTPVPISITSQPAANMSTLQACGKSGAAVFERGSGIAAWQGLEIGYEIDLVLEVPTTPVAADIVSQPADNVGPGVVRSGAAVFANGVGVASWQEAQLDAPVTSAPQVAQPAAPAEDVSAAMAVAMAPPDSSSIAAPAEYTTVTSAAPAVASTREPMAAVTSDVKENHVRSGKKKSDVDTKVQFAIWAACVALVVYRFVFAPA